MSRFHKSDKLILTDFSLEERTQSIEKDQIGLHVKY